MTKINVYIGYDSNEPLAFHTCMHSILKHSSKEISFTPLKLETLSCYSRHIDESASTEFTYSRFLTPYLSNYDGFSLFVDCDFIFNFDIATLFEDSISCKDEWAVKVCKHDYQPKQNIKFLNNKQLAYERKNWSSLIIFNNSKCRMLTPEYISGASGSDLHQFKWITDSEIIELDMSYNFLVGEYEKKSEPPKAIHFTCGGPWFKEYKNCDYREAWEETLLEMIKPLSKNELFIK